MGQEGDQASDSPRGEQGGTGQGCSFIESKAKVQSYLAFPAHYQGTLQDIEE